MRGEAKSMKRTSFVVRILVIGCVIAASALISSVAIATEIQERAKFALAALKSKTAKLGLPKIEGTEFTGDDEYPVLYFGTTKMNNSNEVVDEVVKEHGGIAALGA
jgi:hypothetical protein